MKTFDTFCQENNVTTEERIELVHQLAGHRYRQTLSLLDRRSLRAAKRREHIESMPKYKELIETFINGNLTDAKETSKRLPHLVLQEQYQQATGCSKVKAKAAADYLKGRCTFQQFCDVPDKQG